MPYDLDKCIKCTTCLSQCPVGLVNGLFEGPKRLGPDLARLCLAGIRDYPDSLMSCSNCKSCDLSCPHGVPITRMINLARDEGSGKRSLRLRNRLLADVQLAGKLLNAPFFGVVAAGFSGPGFLARLARKVFGLSPAVGFFHGDRPGRAAWQRIRQADSPKRVVYFPGCYASFFEPRVALSAVRLLNHSGYFAELPEFQCCGLPWVGGGWLAAAGERAAQNIKILTGFARRGYDIVTTCPSCGLMLRKDYGNLLGLEQAAEVSVHVFDLFEFLGRNGAIDPASLQAAGNRWAYHSPCHLRAAGAGLPAYSLLEQIPGLEMVDLDAGCCGLSGSYGLKAENYATTRAVAENVYAAVQKSRPEKILTECGICKIQIAAGTGSVVEHPAIVMAGILGLPRA